MEKMNSGPSATYTRHAAMTVQVLPTAALMHVLDTALLE